VRFERDAVALRVDQGSVVYYRHGEFVRSSARAVVVATGSHSAQNLVAHLLDARRRDIATRYLAGNDVSIAEVAFLLGFSELSSFHRAFKRWTGQTPGEFRTRSHTRTESR